MKFIHISDLHLGKRVYEMSMNEDQRHILAEILKVIDQVQPAAVFIAGDVYDKPLPPAEAVKLLDDFIYDLSTRNTEVFLIAGNHDSADRLAFGSRIIEGSGIHIARAYDGTVEPVRVQDEYGYVNVYMLPFIKPAVVRNAYPDEEISSYTDAVAAAIRHMNVNENERNVIVSHQFVAGAERSDSEEVSVGGVDNVAVGVYDPFDYVALGHIHGPQNVHSERIRYAGTPLKYSFSEAGHKKSVTIGELRQKGSLIMDTKVLKPLHDMRIIRKTYDEVTLRFNYVNDDTEDYVKVVLTDEQEVVDAAAKIKMIYPNLLKLEYDNTRTRTNEVIVSDEENMKLEPVQLIDQFYEKVNNQPMSDIQKQYTLELLEKIQEVK